jgi:hypothetical protein
MTEALGNDITRHGYTKPARGLAGAIDRMRQRREENVMFPRDFDLDDHTPIPEPTGQHAVVVNADGAVFVRLEHRWYQAGGPTVDPVLWPHIHAVRVVSWGES